MAGSGCSNGSCRSVRLLRGRRASCSPSRCFPAPAPRRERLPDTRRSVTHKFSVGGHEGYITVGLYDDGRPGELFITMAKEGSTIGGLMDAFGTAVSMSLQYGVPLEVYVKKFSHTRFEPWGYTKNPDIPVAKSLVDYLFRWMGTEFIPGYREANRPAGHDGGGVCGRGVGQGLEPAPVPLPQGQGARRQEEDRCVLVQGGLCVHHTHSLAASL